MKKMLPWLITILLSITLIVLAVFLLVPQFMDNPSGSNARSAAAEHVELRLTADEIVEVTSEIQDIKTNLADADYIVSVNFSFQLNSKEAKESFEKIKEITIKPVVIQTLADTKPEQLRSAKGRVEFSDKLMELINETIPDGKLTSVKITNFILAPI
ncbi:MULTISPECIES: flagellar basal body-associated FliL family protein [Paenibacillus]|uniref:flagellar basal body-associated FliL family protein n=1 Tax=Paenibacillus TaxID=44249 RepID=UPI0003A3DE6E|nr:flagellar basal body-associated FliL family protein [Paenibacillus massiliensis]